MLPDEDTLDRFGGKHIRVYPIFGKPYEVAIPETTGGGHGGGGDQVMLEQIFSPTPPPDPFAERHRTSTSDVDSPGHCRQHFDGRKSTGVRR